MAVYVLISVTARQGKWAEARQASHDLSKHMAGNSAYVGKYEILQPAGGPNKQHYWLCRFESAAEYEKDIKLRGTDPGFSEGWKAIELSADTDTITSQMLWVRE